MNWEHTEILLELVKEQFIVEYNKPKDQQSESRLNMLRKAARGLGYQNIALNIKHWKDLRKEKDEQRMYLAIKRKRKITTRVIFDGVVDTTFTQMRQVYTDHKGEYVNCDRNQYYIENDSFDIVYTTGKAISGKELFKQHFGVES